MARCQWWLAPPSSPCATMAWLASSAGWLRNSRMARAQPCCRASPSSVTRFRSCRCCTSACAATSAPLCPSHLPASAPSLAATACPSATSRRKCAARPQRMESRATTISGCTRTGAPQARPALSVARHRPSFFSWSKSADGSAARRKHGTRSTRRAAAARAHAWARVSAFIRRATVAFPIASLHCLLYAAPAHRLRSHRSPQPLPHPPNIDLSLPV
mmetsp:Transcript_3936/g.13011  ORF Transcript_3936/g.13011 Transcript_3936/m.13011 type:complete len:216 (+) Transcript_3936:261-908(+)